MAAKRAKASGTGADGRAARPNIIMRGTGFRAQAGVTTTIWISTLISGQAVLSACPMSSLAMTGYGPTVSFTVLVTVHVILGAFGGTRPSTSRSKSSTISGRRCFHHISGVVTGRPSFSLRISG